MAFFTTVVKIAYPVKKSSPPRGGRGPSILSPKLQEPIADRAAVRAGTSDRRDVSNGRAVSR